MQPPLWPSILLQIIFLLLTALFAAAELSIPALDEGELRRQADEGDRSAAQLLRLTARPVRTRTTIQLCVTLCGFFSAVCAALAFGQPLGRWAAEQLSLSGSGAQAIHILAAALVTLAAALIVLTFGYMIPRRVSLHRAGPGRPVYLRRGGRSVHTSAPAYRSGGWDQRPGAPPAPSGPPP